MPPTVQPERRPPRAPAINGHAAFAIAFSISDQSRFSLIFAGSFLGLSLNHERHEIHEKVLCLFVVDMVLSFNTETQRLRGGEE